MRILFSILLSLVLAIPGFSGPDAIDEDTLHVSGKAVVFFGPSQSEYLSMTDAQKDAIDEELYDFYHYRGKVLQFLTAHDIQEFSTARPHIRIRFDDSESMSYLREDFGHVMGIILTDGRQSPRILTGAATKAELILLFEEYFGLDLPGD